MHLGNSIICPVTGIPMILAAVGTAIWCVKKLKADFKKEMIFPAAALTALVFALQMINFTIPSTGSSGHIIGAILLCALLGAPAAFLAIFSILLIQGLFFADGGLMAFGCNVFNMGILACFVAYPFIYKPLAQKNHNFLAILLSSIIALQLGSIAVTAEALISGSITGASVAVFAGLMCGIHLCISIFEWVFTYALVSVVKNLGLNRKTSGLMLIAAFLLGCGICKYASAKPDGLEWSLLNISDAFVAQTQGQIYAFLEALQAKTALNLASYGTFANALGVTLIFILNYALFYFTSKGEVCGENS